MLDWLPQCSDLTPWRSALTLLALVVGVSAMAHYGVQIIKRKFDPHPYTWLLFSVLSGVSFVAQIQSCAGLASLSLASNMVGCLGLFVLSIKGWRVIRRIDHLTLGMAILSIVVWQLTENAVYAVLIASFANVLACLPTLSKIIREPHKESKVPFGIGAIAALLTILALESFSFVNWWYLATIATLNFILVIAIVWAQHHRRLASLMS